MFSWLARVALMFWRPLRRYVRMTRDDNGDEDVDDSLLWNRPLEKHAAGEFSFAVVQANEVIEDHSQVETCQDATFVGVYDGHGGPEASKFISDHLFNHFIRLANENRTISEDVLRGAFAATEDGFLTLVRRSCAIKPSIAGIGSCCLVGVIWKRTLYFANLGDSRVVIGCLDRSRKIVAEQLTSDHNASVEEVRRELKSLHPDDDNIVVLKNGAWRVKGIIQVSRSIGDAYLKRPEFALDPSFPRFHLPEPIRRPVLTAVPSVQTRVLLPSDKFLIFASDGLWEHLTNQEVVELVHKHPRMGIAKRLLQRALTVAAKTRQTSYADIQKLQKGTRRYFHDDITIVVVFIDHDMFDTKSVTVPALSLRGVIDTVGTSKFSALQC